MFLLAFYFCSLLYALLQKLILVAWFLAFRPHLNLISLRVDALLEFM
jgi:hypothetical protein